MGRRTVSRTSPSAGGGFGDGRQVDRAEIALEMGIGRAQPHLGDAPGQIGGLRAQNLAHGVADADQAANDPGVFGRNAFRSLALADLDLEGLPLMIWARALLMTR